MTLYDISEAIRKLVDDTAGDGELIPEQLEELDKLTGDLDAKVDSYCALIAEWESETEAISAQVNRLREKCRNRESNIQRLKDNLKINLEKIGTRKHHTVLWNVSIAKNPPSATCLVEPEELPPEYRKVKITTTPDNAKAISEWKANGVAPPGFEIKQGDSLRIK